MEDGDGYVFKVRADGVRRVTAWLEDLRWDVDGLYPHQQQALRAILEQRFGIVEAPPGSGKTHVFVSLVKQAAAAGVRSVILFRNLSLVRQTKKVLLKQGLAEEDVGLVAGGLRDDDALITLATVQSAHHIGKLDMAVVIADEAHLFANRTSKKALHRLGVHAVLQVGFRYTFFFLFSSFPLSFSFFVVPLRLMRMLKSICI